VEYNTNKIYFKWRRFRRNYCLLLLGDDSMAIMVSEVGYCADGKVTEVIGDALIMQWTNDAYRTITFLEPPTGALLAWLQENAVKQ
jgi:hypothetical protein